MSNRTFACFTCRTTERVSFARITRTCRKCHAPAEHVYYKFRIPRADDDRGWQELMQRVREVNDRIKTRTLAWLRQRAAAYVRNVESAPAHRQKRLRRHLRAIESAIAEWEQWR